MRRLTAILRIAAVISSAALFAGYVAYRALNTPANARAILAGADSPGVTPIGQHGSQKDPRLIMHGSKSPVGVTKISEGTLVVGKDSDRTLMPSTKLPAYVFEPRTTAATAATAAITQPDLKPVPDDPKATPKRKMMSGSKSMPFVAEVPWVDSIEITETTQELTQPYSVPAVQKQGTTK